MQSNSTLPPEQPPAARGQKWLAGIIIGDTVVAIFFGIGALLFNKYGTLGMLGLPSFFLLPMFGGLIASYFWKSLSPTIGATCLNSLWMSLLALFAGAVVFREGLICLLILFPLFYVSVLAGALAGRLFFKTYPPRLNVSILPLFLLAIIGEPLTRARHEGVVTDQIIIQAPASKIWPQLTSFPDIPTPPRFWLFKLGLPYPVSTTAEGDFVNAERRCNFSHNAIFKERVAEFLPGERLTFDIVESPPDPELIGHITPHRGQFVLRANNDGTTTLIGSTWYTLHVRPVLYFDLWTRHIFRSVHLRVMEDIRRRAEGAP